MHCHTVNGTCSLCPAEDKVMHQFLLESKAEDFSRNLKTRDVMLFFGHSI